MTTAFAGAVLDAEGRPFDRIRITGLTATGHHGVFAQEKTDGQTFRADVVLHLDTRAAARGDDLASTVSYDGVADDVVAVLAGSPADLVETVAERIAATILLHDAIVAVDVAVHKPEAPLGVPFDDVEVVIRRDRVVVPVVEPLGHELPEDAGVPQAVPIPVGSVAPALIHGVGQAHDLEPEPELAPAPAVMPPSIPPQGSRPGTAGVPDAGGSPVPAPVLVPGPLSAPDPAGAPAAASAVTSAPDAPSDIDGDDAQQPEETDGTDPDAAPPATFPVSVGMVSAPVPDSHVAPEPGAAPAPQRELDRMDEVPDGFVDVVLALGANLGEPQQTLRQAITDLDRISGLEITEVSPLARTAAVGKADQPDFLNSVLMARTRLSARELLRACQGVENAHGRVRTERWSPRTLDVDLIVYGRLTDVADDLELPHPRAHERAFVLEPWSQIDPDAVLPGLGGGPVAALAATAPDRDGIRWLALDWLTEPAPYPTGAVPLVDPAVEDDSDDEPPTAASEHPSAPPAPPAPVAVPEQVPVPEPEPTSDEVRQQAPPAPQWVPPEQAPAPVPQPPAPQPPAPQPPAPQFPAVVPERPTDPGPGPVPVPVPVPDEPPAAPPTHADRAPHEDPPSTEAQPAWFPRTSEQPVQPVEPGRTDAPAPQTEHDDIIRSVPFAPVRPTPTAPGPLADRAVAPAAPQAPDASAPSRSPFDPVSSHPGDPQL